MADCHELYSGRSGLVLTRFGIRCANGTDKSEDMYTLIIE